MRKTQKASSSLRISPRPSVSLKCCAGIFLGIFGAVWLLFEPLPSLGLLPALLPVSRWHLYAALILISSLSTVLAEYVRHRRAIGRTSYAQMTLVLTEIGSRQLVEVPRDMRIEEMLEILLRRLAKRAMVETTLSRQDMYAKTMLVQLASHYEEIDGKLTIREAGLKGGESFRVRGRLRPVHRMVAFSGGTSASRKKVVDEMETTDAAYNRIAALATRLDAVSADLVSGESLNPVTLAAARRDVALYEAQWKQSGWPDPWKNPRLF